MSEQGFQEGFDPINACSCCTGVEGITPASTVNRPGLSGLAYRVGRHGSFKQSLLAALSTLPALRHLTTRRDDDFTIALLDSWAAALDVLTFYQERIANEGFLRTAQERLSLLELARTIGYELRPGVAAGTYLAFTLDGSPGSPEEIVLPAGTRVQSLPGQDELPQPFETSQELLARPEWSAFRPRLTRPHPFSESIREFLLKGTNLQLRPGDKTLLVASESVQKVLTVVRVEADGAKDHTRLSLAEVVGKPVAGLPAYKPASFTAMTQIDSQKQALKGAVLTAELSQKHWTFAQWSAYTENQGWSVAQVSQFAKAKARQPAATGPRTPPPAASEPDTLPPPEPGLYALRARAGIFGHNAMHWETTPIDWRVGPGSPSNPKGPYPDSWEDRTITQKARKDENLPAGVIHLERSVSQILTGSWAVLQDRTGTPLPFRVQRADEESVADFGLSSKASRLTLDATTAQLNAFKRRGTTAFAQSEKLELADPEVTTNVQGGLIELDVPDFLLAPGRLLSVRGERADFDGVEDGEIVEVEEVLQVQGVTQLVLAEPLAHPYKRRTVTLNANVVPATHGETKSEVLGSGDAAAPFQRFSLKQQPLTYVSAPVPSGGEATLQVRVNGVLWHEAPSFYALLPGDRRYVLRRRDDGVTDVLFGDGRTGARLPTGTENIRVVYRVGIGLDGVLERDRITLLATRPLGVREVTNPVPSRDAQDPETRDEARSNAPLTVKTLDRIVSLTDFEDFARAFSGIGKAGVHRIWDGARHRICLTLAAADGSEPSGDLLETLRQAMDPVRDPSQPLELKAFEPVSFTVGARLTLDPDHLPEAVLPKAEAALRQRFSFERQQFGQGVAKSEVLAVLQRVDGVIAVDLEAFHLTLEGPGSPVPPVLPAVLPALGARRVIEAGQATILPAQLLLLTAGAVHLEALT